MKTIIADTNFLIDCAANKIDIEKELSRILDERYEFSILDRTMEELDTLIHKKGKIGRSAQLAKTILLTKQVNTIMTEGGHVDRLLLKRAGPDVLVATADREIKQKLKKKGYDHIVIRAKKKLALVKA